jgi:trimeric autotransporter adhesin
MTSKARTLSRIVTGDRLANSILDAVNTAVIQTNLPAFQGDATSSAGGNTLTLASSGVTAGTYGNTTAIPVITVDAKGRITTATTNSVSGVTGVSFTPANSTITVSTSTVAFDANINAANATVQGLITVLDSVTNTSVLIAASANSVTNAYDRAIDANTRAASAQTAAASAYTNAVAYAASNSYVNSTFAPLTGATFTGNVTATNIRSTGSVQIDGDLTVSGNTVTVNATNLSLEDNMIYLNANNTVTHPDLGIAGNYNDGSYKHAGFFRDATDARWKVFDGYTPEPDASAYIDTANASFRIADIQANTVYAANAIFTGDVSGITTLAAGNTTITGFVNATSYAYANNFVPNGTTPLTTAVSFGVYSSGAWINSPTGTNGYLGTAGSGIVKWSASGANVVGTFQTSGATTLSSTLAAGNTTITGFANVTGPLAAGNTTINGQLLKGYTSSIPTPTQAGAQLTNFGIQSSGTTMATASYGAYGWIVGTSSASAPMFAMNRSSSNTIGTFSAVTTGNVLGVVNFAGDSGTQFESAASIVGVVDGAVSSTSMPGLLSFRTSGASSVVPTERMRIDSSGNIGIGTSSPAQILHVFGGANTNLWLQKNTSGATTFDGSGAGIDITAAGMNTTNKYTPAIKFGSTDAEFTTTNPKFGASIVASAVQSYTTDTTGGMNLEFWTSPVSPGTGHGLVQRMIVSSNGNVGIGVTSPRAPLDLGSQNNRGQVILLGEVGTNTRVGLGLDASNAGMRLFTYNSSDQQIELGGIASDGSTWTRSHRFGVAGGNSFVQEQGGNFGVGTTSPGTKLSVNGTVTANGYYGKSYAVTSSNTSMAIVDTGIAYSSYGSGSIYQVYVTGNPNQNGSGSYLDILYGKIHIATGYGYSGSPSVRNYIYFVQENPPRPYGSGGVELTIDAVFLYSGTEYTEVTDGTSAQIRIKVGFPSGQGVAGFNCLISRVI